MTVNECVRTAVSASFLSNHARWLSTSFTVIITVGAGRIVPCEGACTYNTCCPMYVYLVRFEEDRRKIEFGMSKTLDNFYFFRHRRVETVRRMLNNMCRHANSSMIPVSPVTCLIRTTSFHWSANRPPFFFLTRRLHSPASERSAAGTRTSHSHTHLTLGSSLRFHATSLPQQTT